MAQGFHHTHAAKSQMSMERLAEWAVEATAAEPLAKKIRVANTAREALGFIRNDYPAVVSAVGERMLRSAHNLAGPQCKVEGVIFDYDGTILFDSMKR